MKKKSCLPGFIPAFFLFTLIIFNLTFPLPLKAGKESKSASLEEIEATIHAIMAEGKIPGAGIVLIKEGKPILQKGYGTTDLRTHLPVTTDTLFELGSCSKSSALLNSSKPGMKLRK